MEKPTLTYKPFVNIEDQNEIGTKEWEFIIAHKFLTPQGDLYSWKNFLGISRDLEIPRNVLCALYLIEVNTKRRTPILNNLLNQIVSYDKQGIISRSN